MSGDKKRFSVTLPVAYVETIGQLVEAGVYLDSQDAIRDALRRLFQYHEMSPFYPEAEGGMSSNEVRCPKCNGIMEKHKFVDTWYSDGKPLDVFEDWWCPACRLRWRAEDAEPEEASGW